MRNYFVKLRIVLIHGLQRMSFSHETLHARAEHITIPEISSKDFNILNVFFHN
jgi:hypothetical protein